VSGGIRWGCWKCDSPNSRVIATGYDDDGIKIRLRRCTRCSATWETEEQRIAPGTFHQRDKTKREHGFLRRGATKQICQYCGNTYPGRGFKRHAAHAHPWYKRTYATPLDKERNPPLRS